MSDRPDRRPRRSHLPSPPDRSGGRGRRRLVPGLRPLEPRALLDGSALVPADFDGDSRTDPALYRFDADTGSGVFEILDSTTGSPRALRIDGLGERDVPVTGDYDGDGRADAAVVRPEAVLGGGSTPNASVWVILRSSDGSRVEIPFGAAGILDRPAPADYDGDGVTDLATFRASSDLVPGAAQWFVRPSSGAPGFSVVFGAAGGSDLPAPADYDGDGRADLATFRPVPTPQDGPVGAAQWFLLPSGANDPDYRSRIGGVRVPFGAPGNADQPVPADFDGDGRADLAAFRSESDLTPGSASWFVLPGRGAFPRFSGGVSAELGRSGSIASAGDFDGDGRPDFAAFDPGLASWAVSPATPEGRPSLPPSSFRFSPAGGGGVPVSSPLFFRLREGSRDEPDPPTSIPVLGYEVVAAFPHDPDAFTQGLAISGGRLFEGTGLYGSSRLREVDLRTGDVLREAALPDSAFGEGIAVVGDRIVQLTWRGGIGYVYERDTFQHVDSFRYEGEGWGLAFDGTRLILSDGTPTLRFLDPTTFEVVRTVRVVADGSPVDLLNELEFIDGEVYANVWKTDRIARIDPETGRVTAWVDLSGLRPPGAVGPEAVLNGIAHDPDSDRLFVTGKNWPGLFEIELVSPG
ncbi:glutaminyl-peptide cyclotransferase [Tautonia plasticadhaerens]|uniref:Glutamine cyclotransferase n=1 Tax=Tautonia plasticadhaerens TaxID=2527974 RepID=A0A518HC28_9BACT|nr:glutaminyl-peptide cyclotransferase [Tautonia plasticadhaerens]QDV38418.1 Glutamine cyclotransferase [Tautonia plasticadhaerens]